jgi:hypothetical protein
VNNFAPIVIPTYNRYEKFKVCMEALSNCADVAKHDIFVFIDGARDAESRKAQNNIMHYLSTLSGSELRLNIEIREHNLGASQNCFLAQAAITQKYGRSIYMEDDVVPAPGYLRFMNDALNFYEEDLRVLSVAGFSPVDVSSLTESGVYFSNRFNAWGSGIWRRSLEVYPSREMFKHVSQDFIDAVDVVEKKYGSALARLAKKVVDDELDAQDIRNTLVQIVTNRYTAYPVKSFVSNIGHDGSGVHCSKTTIYESVPIELAIRPSFFTTDVSEDNRILAENFKFRQPGLFKRLLARTKAYLQP